MIAASEKQRGPDGKNRRREASNEVQVFIEGSGSMDGFGTSYIPRGSTTIVSDIILCLLPLPNDSI